MRFGALVPDPAGPVPGYLWPRWIFLRGLGAIFFSAFFSLAFQIHGLIGPRGILPAGDYLHQVAQVLGPAERFWYAPTLLWLGSGSAALTVLVAGGIVASLLLAANVCPRGMVAVCTVLFLSCVAALQDFSSYQSDGMLLEAGFISFFFAPRGVRPGLGAADPPSRLSLFMLRWEWFRIYFESGIVKLASGDPHWRDLTAMDEYYQNGPLPTWPGWYVQHFPHWYHAGTVILTLVVELVLVWAVFAPRRFRIACFAVVTALQIGIIATANYAFLNYLVLLLGILLLDDAVLARARLSVPVSASGPPRPRPVWRRAEAVALGVAVYVTVAGFLLPFFGGWGMPGAPVRLLAPFRIANSYGLFAVMTEARYEIEFQGSRDGRTWVAYPFRYKPQDPRAAPGIYAPYQPRFEWNLWFASLGPWQQSSWVVAAQQRLIEGSPGVLRLFRRDPFGGRPPAMVRTVLYRYWFTDLETKRKTGMWWRRRQIGEFTGTLRRAPDGGWSLENEPTALPPLNVTAPDGR
ncbi:lipase maturation factor family protein [Longimicrobium sp.]|uniref:lipase maturation factor family protein n=1 Tax=Longimicrobium sp. TaxID=2029185 RepID=UPI002CCF54F0|nr:lipase maturation factor family protein [Longimicrobium sp.]HSU16969.1 lipase maturation factor family protein [Longimicrobium sp.]